MHAFDLLDVGCDGDLFFVDSVLMALMVVTFLSQLLPSGFGIISNNLSISKLLFHLINFSLHLSILVVNVGYKSNSVVLERALLLKLEPFLLEYVHSLIHLALCEEVSDEVIDNNRSFY